jgi:phosphopantetheinyl transferase
VGVDIDFPRAKKYRELSKRMLSPSEREDFINSAYSNDFFNRIWTQKEAISKACGLGMSLDFSRLIVNDCQLPVFCPTTGKEYFVETVPLFGGYVSVASEGSKPDNLIIDIKSCLALARIIEEQVTKSKH